jgi:hypothetical protein
MPAMLVPPAVTALFDFKVTAADRITAAFNL